MVASGRPGKVERGPPVAGVELASDGIRAVVGHREDGRLRVTGVGRSAVRPGALTGGVVVDREAVGAAVASALALAEARERASRVVATVDGDDVRTYHVATTFERERLDAPIGQGEVARAVQEARAAAEQEARGAAANDPALRGVATVQLRDDLAGLSLDGRPLASLVGLQGRYVEVRTDVAVAPLVVASAATGALAAARRRATLACGAYALARVLVLSGLTDAGVLRLGADVTAHATIRDGRVIATRGFGLGRDAFASPERSSRIPRDPETDGHETGSRARRERDASVWARCVAAPHPGDGVLPTRWHFVGVPEELVALPRALGEVVAEGRGGAVEIAPLRPALAGRLIASEALHADDLVAAGAAALAAEIGA